MIFSHFYRVLASKIKNADLRASYHFFQLLRAEKFYFTYKKDYVSNSFSISSQLESEIVRGFSICIQDYRAVENYLEEYIVHYTRPCIIEPRRGWAIDEQHSTLIFESIGSQSWEIAPYPSYIKYKVLPKKTVDYEEVISLRMIRDGWNNYWHFMHDILGQLLILEENNLVKDRPILIPESLAQKQFFKDAINRSSYLKSRNWVVQNNFYVKANNALFAQRMPHAKNHFDILYDILEATGVEHIQNKKIFLTRQKHRGRTLKNIDEIEEIVQSYKFEVIDTDKLNLHEQIETFANARYVIAIHGAGLLNILFRKPALLHLLEIFPLNYVQIHYYWLCQMYGFDYSAVVGENGESKDAFYLNPHKFEAKLRQMLA